MEFELSEDLLSFAGRSKRDFDHVVQAFVGAVVSVRGQCLDRFDLATQFIGDDDAWLATLGNQSS